MRRVLTTILRVPVQLFYRRWTLGGEVPEQGPLLLVANHPNGLVDPVVATTLAARPLRFLAKEPLFRMPIVGAIVRSMGSLPVYRPQDGADTARNEDTFRAVFEALAAGEAVCLFPEGVSHSEPELQRLKTGAARMALGAEALAHFQAGLRIVPVGFVYSSKQRFRSKLATWVGEPIGIADLEILHGEDPRQAVAELTERVAAGLRRVTVNLSRWEDLPLLEIVERIWRPEPGSALAAASATGGSARVARLAQIAQGVQALRERDPEKLHRLERDVENFAGLLQRLRIAPDDLRIDYRSGQVARFVVRNILELAVGLPLALLGMLIWGVPYLLVTLLAPLTRPSEDLVATHKLLAALLLYPLWWFSVALTLHLQLGPAAALIWAVASPWVGYYALRALERQFAAREDASAFLRLGSHRALKSRLRERRDALAARIDDVARELQAR